MKKKKSSKALTTVILMLVGGGVGFLAARYGMVSARNVSTTQLLVLTLLFLPAFFLVIAVHEAGHAIAGNWVNFDFRMYVVGPFMWDKQETGWTFKWNRNVNVSGGLVICLPNSTENLARRFAIYALGGPAASLIFTVLAWVTSQMIAALNVNNSLFLKISGAFMGMLAVLSLLIFIITIVPMHTGGFYTDGARAIRFLRGGDTSRFELLLMKIITSSSAGIRPRLLDKADINEALELAQKTSAPTEVYVHYYLYQASLDNEEIEEAESHLNEYLKRITDIPQGFRGSVHLDVALFNACMKNDLETAEHHWRQYEPSAVTPKSQVYATEAAIYMLKNDERAAQEKIDLALAEIPNMIDRGVGQVLKERLLQMKGKM